MKNLSLQNGTLLVLLLAAGLWTCPAGVSAAQKQAGLSAAPTLALAAADVDTSNADTQAEETEKQSEESAPPAETQRTRRHGRHHQALVVFGRDAELKAGDSAEAVVAIGGSARVQGHVDAAVVAIGGDVFVDGDVGE